MKTIKVNYQNESYLVYYNEESQYARCEPYNMTIEDTFTEMLEDIGEVDQDYFLELIAENASFNIN
jgi:hypothetical protein